MAALKSGYDGSLNELYSKEKDIDLLKQQLDAAKNRDKELQ